MATGKSLFIVELYIAGRLYQFATRDLEIIGTLLT